MYFSDVTWGGSSSSMFSTERDVTFRTSANGAPVVTNLDELAGVRNPAGLAEARVVWLDVRGGVLAQEDEMLDPYSPNLSVPSGVLGLCLARVSFDGGRSFPVRRLGSLR